jgi:hypothetical protein
MDIDDIVDELLKIRIYDIERFREKLALIKNQDIAAYLQITKILALSEDELQRISLIAANPQRYKREHKTTIQRTNASPVFVLLGMLAIGFILIGAIFFVISSMPVTSNVTRGALESVTLGYELFMSSENTSYLFYSSEYNRTNTYSGGSSKRNEVSREYFMLNNDKYDNMIITFDYCPLGICGAEPTTQTSRYRRIGDNYNFTMFSDIFNITFCLNTTYRLNIYNALSIYEEAYYLAKNGYVIDSSRENNWQLGGIDCAPILLEISNSSGLYTGTQTLMNITGGQTTRLVYELCINNEGVPLAIARYHSYYTNLTYYSQDVYVAYLESTDANILSVTRVDDKTLDEYSSIPFNCSFTQ